MIVFNRKAFCLVVVALMSSSVNAWDGTTTGHIRTIDVTSGNNYGFRVSLEGVPALCGNSHTWAFLNDTDSNYQTYISVLLAAKAAKMTVTLFTTRVNAAPDGYCKIGYISVN